MSIEMSPTERVRAEIDELFDSGRDPAGVLEDAARLIVYLRMEAALEAEVTAYLDSGTATRA